MTKKLNESTDSHIVRLLFLRTVHQKRNRRRKSKLCAAGEESSSPLALPPLRRPCNCAAAAGSELKRHREISLTNES